MLGLALCAGALAAGTPSETGDAPPDAEMRTYVVGLLMTGESAGELTAEQVQTLQREHLAYMSRLHREGKLLLAGPFLDGGDLRGMCVYDVTTVEEARALGEADPAVKAGRLRFEFHPWYSAKGIGILPRAEETGQGRLQE